MKTVVLALHPQDVLTYVRCCLVAVKNNTRLRDVNDKLRRDPYETHSNNHKLCQTATAVEDVQATRLVLSVSRRMRRQGNQESLRSSRV